MTSRLVATLKRISSATAKAVPAKRQQIKAIDFLDGMC
jgi:hypothetical protein